MKFVYVLLLCAIPALGGCKSSGDDAAAAVAQACTCGTPEGDFEGCAHPSCMKGVNNPDNPNCVCGTMQLGGKK